MQFVIIQLCELLTLRRQARIDFHALLARQQWWLFDWRQVVQLTSRLTANRQHIRQSGVGDINRFHPLAFENGIGGDRGAMNNGQRMRIQPKLTNALQYRLLGRMRRRQHLVQAQAAVFLLQKKIGKGAAGVYAQNHHARILLE